MANLYSRPIKFVAAFDTHIGEEYAHVRGRRERRLTHNPKAIRAFLRFAQDFGPDAMIFGGDNINCGPVSRWSAGKPRLTEDFRLKRELEWFDELLLSPLEQILPRGGIKKLHNGNHEYWIEEFLNAHPELEGMIEPEQYLRLEERGWEIYDYGELSQLGKLHFVHGDVVMRKGSAATAAKRLVDHYGRNIRAGHRHVFQASPKITPVDVNDVHTGVLVPCLATRAPEYMKNAPNEYMNGFLFGDIWPDGYFTDHVMVMIDNKFSWNGKLYDGNKS